MGTSRTWADVVAGRRPADSTCANLQQKQQMGTSNTWADELFQQEEQMGTSKPWADVVAALPADKTWENLRAANPADEPRSLYICMFEFRGGNSHYNIYAVKLSDLLSKSLVDIRTVTRSGQMNLPEDMTFGVLGSEFVVAGGHYHHKEECSDVYVFKKGELVKHSEFLKPKHELVLFELQGKFYALAGRPCIFNERGAFEMFDPNTKLWNPLPDSPYKGRYPFPYSHLIFGTKIMISTCKSPVYCFDTAEAPENAQWTQVSSQPFPFGGRALVLDLDDEDDFKLMFAYAPSGGIEWDVVAYAMSNTDYSIEPIQPLRLMHGIGSTREFGRPDQSCKFVHLGGQKVSFATARFTGRTYHDPCSGWSDDDEDCGGSTVDASSPRTYSADGSARFCDASGVSTDDVVPEYIDPVMRILVGTFEFAFLEKTSRSSFTVKSSKSRIIEIMWPFESDETIDAELLCCFVG